ncbi:MAG: hypothetical protein GC149_15220 [Gammaproteobacteria bacterium]|nr:hypothetical protein [Gammaproteobacteria bacterium]
MYQLQASERFHHGQIVWVRAQQEILATLDDEGKLDGLPFMPEMSPYCGRSFRVSSIPTMTCVEGVGFRGLKDIIFLENLRCSGDAHDGCQRDCLLFWREAWLSDHPVSQSPAPDTLAAPNNTQLKTKHGARYFCQSTELSGVVTEFRPEDSRPKGKLAIFKKIFRDLLHGEMTIAAFTKKIVSAFLNRLKALLGMDTGGQLTGQRQKTETLSLGLQPGEWIEIKSRKEIAETLDSHGKNRGLLFDIPMGDYCGQRFQVENQLRKIILEETGQMVTLTNTVLLKNNVCTAWGCPRANRFFWREIWLRRVEPGKDT